MDMREKRDLAWLGDAVLALYARQWLLDQPGHPQLTRQERFIRFTSNEFLQSIGEPTEVEAQIGQAYRESGIEAAFQWIKTRLQPRFEQHLRKATRGRQGQKTRLRSTRS